MSGEFIQIANEVSSEEDPEALLERLSNIDDKDTLQRIEISKPFEAVLTFSSAEVEIVFAEPLHFFSFDENIEEWEQTEEYRGRIDEFAKKVSTDEEDSYDDVLGADTIIKFEEFNPAGGETFYRHNIGNFFLESKYHVSFDSSSVLIDKISFNLDLYKDKLQDEDKFQNIAENIQDVFASIEHFLIQVFLFESTELLEADTEISELTSIIKEQLGNHVFNELKEEYIVGIRNKIAKEEAIIVEQQAYKERQKERESDLSLEDWIQLLPEEIFQKSEVPTLIDSLNESLEVVFPKQKSIDISNLIAYLEEHKNTCSVEYIFANNGNIFKIIIDENSFLLKGTRGSKGQELLKPLFAMVDVVDGSQEDKDLKKGIRAFENQLVIDDPDRHMNHLIILLSEVYAQQLGYEISRQEIESFSNLITFIPTIGVCDNDGWPTCFLRPFEKGENLTFADAVNKLKINDLQLNIVLTEVGILMDMFEHSRNFFITPEGRLSIIDASLGAGKQITSSKQHIRLIDR